LGQATIQTGEAEPTDVADRPLCWAPAIEGV
jgi:hypothetical protein